MERSREMACSVKCGSASWKHPEWKALCTLPAGHDGEHNPKGWMASRD